MTIRSFLLAAALLAASTAAALAQAREEIASPTLRAQVTVSGDLVRIGDVVDNAGLASEIAIYRAPDLGTTGSLPTAKVIATLRAHQVIGVDTRGIREIQVTRRARTVETREIEAEVAHALERKNGLGDAANISLTFDRGLQDVQLDAASIGAPQAVAARFDSRSGRFDVTLEIASEEAPTPARLRFTGTAVETVEVAVLTRGLERNEIIKASDVVVERRPKAEVGADAAGRERSIGMQARRQLRAGAPLKAADLSKPDLVQRDQAVTLIFETTGLYLTIRGKALETGTEGDVVNVLNLQSKRTISGVVTGRGQVTVSTAPRAVVSDAASSSGASAPISVAVNSTPHTAAKTE